MAGTDTLDRAAFSMRELAAAMQLNYSTVRSLAIARRAPHARDLIQLANGMDERAMQLAALADELRKAAKG